MPKISLSLRGYSFAESGREIINYVEGIKKTVKDTETKRKIALMIMETAKPYVPYDTGNLEDHTYVDENGRIVYDTVYAKRLYYGDGFRFSTEKHPMACARWLEVSMGLNGSYILYNTAEIIKKQAKQTKGGNIRL